MEGQREPNWVQIRGQGSQDLRKLKRIMGWVLPANTTAKCERVPACPICLLCPGPGRFLHSSHQAFLDLTIL